MTEPERAGGWAKGVGYGSDVIKGEFERWGLLRVALGSVDATVSCGAMISQYIP